MIPMFLLTVSQAAPAMGQGGAISLSLMIWPVAGSMVRTMFSVEAVKMICLPD